MPAELCVHVTALVDPLARIGEGVTIHPFAIVGKAMIGNGCILGPYVQIDDDVELGDGTCVWNGSHVQRNARIGRNCTLGQNVNVGNHVAIGHHCKIQNNVNIYEGVTLGNYVFCGPSMTFTNILMPRCKHPQRGSSFYGLTIVHDGVSFGAHTTIVCGTRTAPRQIGRDAMVAAGAVVTRDVADNHLVAGVPAAQIGWACEHGVVRKGFSWEGDVEVYFCQLCNRTFPLL